MRNTVVHDYFPNNDATLKDLVLNTACLAQAIRRCLANHFHNHGGCLVPTSDVDSEYMGIKGETQENANCKLEKLKNDVLELLK